MAPDELYYSLSKAEDFLRIHQPADVHQFVLSKTVS